MDHFTKLRGQVRHYVLAALLLAFSIVVFSNWALIHFLDLNETIALVIAGFLALIFSFVLASMLSKRVLEPLSYVWQAILHVSPDHTASSAPNFEQARLGRELITSLVMQVYQMASGEQNTNTADNTRRNEIIQSSTIVSHLPLPLFVFNKEKLVTNASDAALEYCQMESSILFGKPLFDNLKLEFTSDLTLEKWIAECEQNKATDNAYWERVKLRLKDEDHKVRQCDMAAYYNRDNPSGTEFIITIFDRTEQYSNDDAALGFVAVAMHELRTPLTILRGYIEVFQEELSGKINPELTDFLHKMEASAKQLNSFVNNILNAARIEGDQLTIHMAEEDWPDILRASTKDVEILAQIQGINIEYLIAPNLPKVAVDKVSIYEVMNNLLGNAIKYSGKSKKILVSTQLGKDGRIETLVQDFGVGIPESVVPSLFEKFHRNHRNRAQISGTGLGLYLCKSIITAHGGNIWIKSKEGEGTTAGFTLQPYALLASELKNSNNSDITRSTHGWIKNHSFNRR